VITTLTWGLLTVLLAACGSDADQDAEGLEEPAAAVPAQEALTAGRWRIQVSVRPSRVGPIVVSASHPAQTKPTDSKPWIRHDLVFRNTGDRPVTFADTRSSDFIGEGGRARLLAADEGCGYSQDAPQAPAMAGACAAYLDRLKVKPGASARRSIALWKGLPGMDPLLAGTYVFLRPVRFQLERSQPGEGDGSSVVLEVMYGIESHSR
jgi:hypothetical protein